MIPTAPVNKLVVTISKKFYETKTFKSGVTLHIDPSWQPQDYATLTGTVVSVPRGIISRYDYKELVTDGIQPGDTILMRFDVVYSYKNQVDKNTAEFKNLVCLKDGDNYVEYWLCDIQQVFAVIKGDEIRMLNDYIMADPVHEERKPLSEIIIMPESFLKFRRKDKVIVRHARSDNKMKLKAGDIVYVDADCVQEYEINCDKFYIIKERHVQGIVTSFTERIAELGVN